MENSTHLRKNFKGGLYYMGFKEFIRFLFCHFLYRKTYTIGTENILPEGSTVILPGDHAVVVTAAGHLRGLDEILETNG